MRKTYLGGLVLSGVALAFVAFNGCSTSTTRKPVTTGAAGQADTSGAAGTPASTGAAGDSSAAGTTGAAGTTNGAAGADTSGAAGVVADASTTPDTSVAGTSGAAGNTSGAAGADTTGAAGTPVDNSATIPLPIAITADWYPSGWDGDAYTVAAFTANPANVITIAVATDGPCAARVAGALGSCYKVTYTPAIAPDGGVPGNASVALLGNEPGTVNTPDYNDLLGAPRPAQGGTMITAQVAGKVGGENVGFNLGVGGNMAYTPTLTTGWQQLTFPLTGVTYDHVLSPFGWSSSSATPVTFYYDDLRFE